MVKTKHIPLKFISLNMGVRLKSYCANYQNTEPHRHIVHIEFRLKSPRDLCFYVVLGLDADTQVLK